MQNNIIPFNNNGFSETNNEFVFFKLGEKSYAIHTSHTIEVLKLPKLEYPQRLPKHIVGILNYNNLTINIIDLRSILGIDNIQYDINHHLMIVSTQEAIFGIIVDKITDIHTILPSDIEVLPYTSSSHLIKMLYHHERAMISIIDLYSIETILKENEFTDSTLDYEKLFPQEESAKLLLKQRADYLIEKSTAPLVSTGFNQDQFILFNIAQSVYCLNMKYVKELESVSNVKITKLPFAPDYIEGVINLRGDFVTILNLKKFLNIPLNNEIESKKILLLDAKEYKIALLVDEIITIRSIDNDRLITRSANKFESKYTLAEFLEDEKVFYILNAEKILSDERLYISVTPQNL